MAARPGGDPAILRGARGAPRAHPRRRLAGLSAFLLAGAAAAGGCGERAFRVVDEEAFRAVVPEGSRLRRLAHSLGFPEGPVWVGPEAGLGGEGLLFSDLWGDRLLLWREGAGVAVVERGLAGPNGNALGPGGMLYTCEHDARRVRVRRPDGTTRTLVEDWEGGPLNSPNDVVLGPNGGVWFTDPRYGRPQGDSDYGGDFVFRFDTGRGRTAAVVRDLERPNGLAFSPDGRTLYVTDSGAAAALFAYPVGPDGGVGEGRRLWGVGAGRPDGLAVDADGRLYVACTEGVCVLSADGRELFRILAPEPLTDVAFGGAEGRTLFATGRTSLFAVELRVRGAHP